MEYKITFLRAKEGTEGSEKFVAGSTAEAETCFRKKHLDGCGLIITGIFPVATKAECLPNVTIYDNGAGFCVMVNGLTVHHSRALGDAWRHIKWMHDVASQKFTVGAKKIPVEEWIDGMTKAGMLD